MPLDPAEVHVTQDPLVVFALVALFASVIILAVLFATPRFRRLPDEVEMPVDDASPDAGPRPTTATTSSPTATPPWSTAPADPSAPWRNPRDD